MIQALAELGSVSASIILFLGLTREIVALAIQRLHADRAAQTTLTEILSATRYRVYHTGKLYHTKCPKRYCYQRDTFLHMLDCYHLTDRVKRGPEALPFLLHMAHAAKRQPGQIPFPYLAPLSTQTRLQDSAPLPPSPTRSASTIVRSD